MLYVWRNVLRTCRASAVSGCIRTMSSLAIEPAAAQLADGAGVAEASVIDESLFNKTLDLLALRVPAPLCSRIMAALRPTPFLFTHSRLPTVVDDRPAAQQQEQQQRDGGDVQPSASAGSGRPPTKLVLLSPTLTSPSTLPSPVSALVSEHSLTTTRHAVHLTYQMHTLEQVLSAVLPAGVPAPSSFETVGHLAHVNLLPVHLPYRRLIGAAIISHSPGIRCVVNKLSAISDEYRVLPMEVIAGDECDTVTELREHGCVFRFDYRTVYWNSRLATEHRRLVDCVHASDSVVDMFAGIGPFVIPIAKKLSHAAGDGVRLLANDKNQHSVDALDANSQLNGVEGRLRTYNLDARDFIAEVKSQLRSKQLSRVDHVIMNLPASAIEFLDCLRGIYQHDTDRQLSGCCPVVHVYCFSNADDKVADVMSRIQTVIGHELPAPTLTTHIRRSDSAAAGRTTASSSNSNADGARPSAAVARKRKREEKAQAALLLSMRASWDKPLVHFVRNVAPNKDMLCVSFRLPEEVAFEQPNTT